jgi:hypothetical protein
MHHNAGMSQHAAPGMQQAWGAAQGYAPAPGPVPYPAYYAAPAPGWQGPPPVYGLPPQTPAPAAAAGLPPDAFAGAMNELADKSGLGMFKNFLNLDDGEFWKGALVGAAVVLLMTNEDLRNSLIGGAAKTAEVVKSGLSGFAGGTSATGESDENADESGEQTTDEDNEQ